MNSDILTSVSATPSITSANRKVKAFSTLGFNMDLRQPTGLSFKDFKRIISNDSNDRYNIIADNIETFYYMETKYNVNGIFIMAVAIHESGWGTSNIAKDRMNLFGYGAYDRDPYNSSFNFGSYAEGIESVTKALAKHYLNKPGTPIADGQVASGAYYNGPTLSGVNTKYASDKEWGVKVFGIMEYLYGKL